jgi:hypothetical protein
MVYGSTIKNSSVTGNVSSSGNNGRTGGIAGGVGFNSTISDSYSTVNVSGYDRTGGIVGAIEEGRITNSYNTGDINGNNQVGGIAGVIHSSTIANSYNIGNITSTFATGDTGVGIFVGGISGRIMASSVVNNSYSTGVITAGSTDSPVYSGGIVGLVVDSSTVSNSYSTGSVNASSVNADAFAGGIAGGVNSGTILRCAAINPTINAKTGAGSMAGQLWNASVHNSNNRQLNTMTALGVSFNEFVGISKTDVEFKTRATYADLGWDMVNVWKMPASGGYPILFWQ